MAQSLSIHYAGSWREEALSQHSSCTPCPSPHLSFRGARTPGPVSRNPHLPQGLAMHPVLCSLTGLCELWLGGGQGWSGRGGAWARSGCLCRLLESLLGSSNTCTHSILNSADTLPLETLHLLKASLSFLGALESPRGSEAAKPARRLSVFPPEDVVSPPLRPTRPCLGGSSLNLPGRNLAKYCPRLKFQKKKKKKVRREGAPSSAERK